MSEPVCTEQQENDIQKATEIAVPCALPPPPPLPKAAASRRYTLQRLACALCAALAICVLSLCALQKATEILSQGVFSYFGEELLAKNPEARRSLGDRVSAVAFGDLLADTEAKAELAAALLAPIAFPRVYYIPKEQVLDKIYSEKDELAQKIFDLYSFDYAKVPSGTYPILPTDLAASSATDLKNDTSFSVDMQAIAKETKLREAEAIPKEPLVLIVHTHGTEAFSDESLVCYNDDFNVPRSENVSKNVVAVGKTLCEALNKKGVPTLHCETMHDKESYISAYERSGESIRYYLEKYPSVRYVFDVHRDSVIRSDLTKLRPVTLRNGEPCAQIMMIVGSDEKGAGEYDWENNLLLAEAIQQHLFADTLGIARQIYLRGASYNQQYAQYGLLLEVGSCGNSLSEAKLAALAFADAFEKVLKGE